MRRYMPEISINRALMDTLTEAEREAWVEATPTRVFRYNAVTKQVCAGVPSPAQSTPLRMSQKRGRSPACACMPPSGPHCREQQRSYLRASQPEQGDCHACCSQPAVVNTCRTAATPASLQHSMCMVTRQGAHQAPEAAARQLKSVVHWPLYQVEVENAEAYMYDGECLAKAEELGKPGLVTIKQKQVRGIPSLQDSMPSRTHAMELTALLCGHATAPDIHAATYEEAPDALQGCWGVHGYILQQTAHSDIVCSLISAAPSPALNSACAPW